jgi:hypothetical protein
MSISRVGRCLSKCRSCHHCAIGIASVMPMSIEMPRSPLEVGETEIIRRLASQPFSNNALVHAQRNAAPHPNALELPTKPSSIDSPVRPDERAHAPPSKRCRATRRRNSLPHLLVCTYVARYTIASRAATGRSVTGRGLARSPLGGTSNSTRGRCRWQAPSRARAASSR